LKQGTVLILNSVNNHLKEINCTASQSHDHKVSSTLIARIVLYITNEIVPGNFG